MTSVVELRGHGPFDTTVDDDFLRRYGEAIGAGPDVVPAMALAGRIFEAQNEARMTTLPEAIQQARGVHGEHDLVVDRPVVAGETLRTWVTLHGIRPAGRNTAVTLRYATVDAADALVAEQWWTTVFLAITLDPEGEATPDHRFPDEARTRRLGTSAVDVDVDTARRYAEASGDWSAHHFEVDAARSSGFDRPFLHGLCTMALCASAVVDLAAAGDHARLRRVAVRFASPIPLGERLDVAVYDAGPLGLAFEATCAGTTVVSHGRAELHLEESPT